MTSVAVVGAGWAASHHVGACRTLGVPIVSICSRTLSRARQLLDAHGYTDSRVTDRYEEVLVDADVDVIVIASPNNIHAEQAIAAARYGKHILVEKPIALTPSDVRRVVAAVREAGVSSATGFVQRAGLYQRQVKDYVLQGLVGQPFHVEVGYVTYQTAERFQERAWMRTAQRAGSTFLLSGIHAVDTIRWVASRDPEAELDIVEVYAQARATRSETDYPDFAVALLRFADGASGVVTSHLSSRGMYVPPIVLFGDLGTIRGDELWSEATDGPRGWLRIPQPHPVQQSYPALYTRHLADFLDALATGRPAPTRVEATVNTHDACFAVDWAVARGRPVQLPLLDA